MSNDSHPQRMLRRHPRRTLADRRPLFSLESLEPRTLLSAVLTQPISDLTLGSNPSATVVDLNNHFNDPTVNGTVVKFTTALGNFFVELYGDQAPTTVTNFLNYVNSNSYDDTFIHRTNANFSIIQGGSFTVEPVADGIAIDDVITGAPIPMEFVVPNIRGTIAMARSSAQDSATSGFFFNTADNTDIWTAQNPYAAFGGVLYNGMTVVDTIQALQNFPFGSPFDEVPLVNYTVDDFNAGNPVLIGNVVVVNSVQVVGELVYTITGNTNPDLVTPTINNAGQLTLNYGTQGGTANITVRATDHGGNFVQDTFQITLAAAATAVNDTAATRVNVPVLIPVLNNDSGGDGTLVPSTVAIATGPSHGQVSVNTTTGVITYTPADGYFGADSFTYTVDNNLGETTSPATVSISINSPPAAVADAANAGGSLPVVIDVLANDSDVDGTLNPASVAIASAPANGQVTVNPATGAITYTANAGFVGTDTFTYTVADNIGDVSAPATVTVTVDPFAITLGEGGTKTVILVFNDANSARVTLKLNVGTALLRLEGENLVQAVNRNNVVITGDNLRLVGIDLQNTTNRSNLTINGKVGDGLVEVGDISGDGALRNLAGKFVHLTGDLNLGEGLALLNLNRITGSTITLGASPTGAALALRVGDVIDGSLVTANGIRSLIANTWVDSDSQTDIISAVWMGRTTFRGDVSADVTLTGEDGRANTLAPTRVVGTILGGTWSIAGNTAPLRAGASAAPWSINVTGNVAAMTFDNDASGAVTANSIRKLVGKTSLRNMTLTLLQGVDPANAGTVALANLNVKQWLDNVEIRSAGSMNNIRAGGAMNTTIFAGVDNGVNQLPDSGDDFTAMANIKNVRLTGVAGEPFWLINSHIAAFTINSVNIGFAQLDNGGEPFGVAATSIRSVLYRDANVKLKLTKAEDFGNLPDGNLVVREINSVG